ncbi:MAG: hypothetical protein WBM17_00440 [Anaerolineales bacterium]
MLKSSLIAVPVTAIVILITGFLSELCCCASPFAAVFLGLAAGALCVFFEKPFQKDRALKRGATAGAIAGLAALPAQVLGEIVVALVLAGSGKVDISLFGLPAASATVDLWNWILNALFAACLYGLTAAAIMAGMGAVGGALWFRISRKGKPMAEVEPQVSEFQPVLTDQAANSRKMFLSGILMAVVAFVFILLITTTWGCLALPAALIMGSITGVLSGSLSKPRSAGQAAVYGGIAGWIASTGSFFGDIVGLLIRTFLIQTPQGINSMTEGLYNIMGTANSYGARTPAEILMGDVPIVCCCGVIYAAAFIGFGALGGLLWFQRKGRKHLPSQPEAPVK